MSLLIWKDYKFQKTVLLTRFVQTFVYATFYGNYIIR